MHKFPAGHENPKSLRPACEGNGITALRFTGMTGDEERFERIACPNLDCPFAMAGQCKPSAHLVFMLRWDRSDPFEAGFPALVAEYTTGGWESLAGMRGLFEFVLGTAAVRTPEEVATATADERATWRAGLAAELGIAETSLVGMPFVMTVTERTKAAKGNAATGTRYPVVSFSPDGDLVEWLLNQARRRKELAGAPEPLALPSASVQAPYFEEITRHESRAEVRQEVLDITPEPPVRLPADSIAELQEIAARAELPWDELEEMHLGCKVADLTGPSVAAIELRVNDLIRRLSPARRAE